MPAVVLELYVLQKGGFPAHAHLAGVPLLRGQFMQLPPPPLKTRHSVQVQYHNRTIYTACNTVYACKL